MFGKKRRTTCLRQFIDESCSVEAANGLFSTANNKEEGFSLSLAIIILAQAGIFASGLDNEYRTLVEDFPNGAASKAYEITIFEITCWCYATLFWQDVRSDSSIQKKNAHTRLVLDSAVLAVNLIAKWMPAENNLAADFDRRVKNYQLQMVARTPLADVLTSRLHSSLIRGVDSANEQLMFEGGAFLMVPLTLSVQLFAIHVIPSIVSTATELFTKDVAPMLAADDDEDEDSDPDGD